MARVDVVEGVAVGVGVDVTEVDDVPVDVATAVLKAEGEIVKVPMGVAVGTKVQVGRVVLNALNDMDLLCEADRVGVRLGKDERDDLGVLLTDEEVLTDAEGWGVAVTLGVPVVVDVIVDVEVAVPVSVRVPVANAVSVTVAVAVGDGAGVAVGLAVKVPVEVPVVLPVTLPVELPVEVAVELAVAVNVALAVAVAVAVAEAVAVAVAVAEAVAVSLATAPENTACATATLSTTVLRDEMVPAA